MGGVTNTLAFTPKQNISKIVESVGKAFKTGKTLPIEWRKEQLRQVWRMLDVGFLYLSKLCNSC
jgi:hypothetical protein